MKTFKPIYVVTVSNEVCCATEELSEAIEVYEAWADKPISTVFSNTRSISATNKAGQPVRITNLNCVNGKFMP